jgi:hypothetical protein
MNLRCKPGDIAYVVKSYGVPFNEGKLVDVVRFIGTYTFVYWGTQPDTWECILRQPMVSSHGEWCPAGTRGYFRDMQLRPIANPDDPNGILTFTPEPQKETA